MAKNKMEYFIFTHTCGKGKQNDVDNTYMAT